MNTSEKNKIDIKICVKSGESKALGLKIKTSEAHMCICVKSSTHDPLMIRTNTHKAKL